MKRPLILLLVTLMVKGLYGQHPIALNSIQRDPATTEASENLKRDVTQSRPGLSEHLLEGIENRLDSALVWEWDTLAGSWVISGRYLYGYDAGPDYTTVLQQRLVAGQWSDYFLYTYTYDAQGNLTNYTEQYWNGSSWRNTYNYIYVYDANNDLVEDVIQQWNVNAWKNFLQVLYTYDDQHNLLTSINKEWQAIAWVNTIKRDYTYDTSNLVTYQLRQDWDSGWEDAFRYYYTYDTLQNLVDFLSDKWSGNAWVKNYRNDYQYDSNNNRTLFRRLNPAGFNFWTYDYQFLYSYDEYNNLISDTEQEYSGNEWVNVDRGMYTYNEDQNLLTEVYQDWITDWLNIDSTYYFYNPVSAISDPSLRQEITLYPNPASSVINLQLKPGFMGAIEYMVINDYGVVVSRATVAAAPQIEVNVSKLPAGLYHLVVEQGAKRASVSFIKL